MRALLRRAWDQFKRQGTLGKAIILLVAASVAACLPSCCCGGLINLVNGPSTPTLTAVALVTPDPNLVARAVAATLTAQAPTPTPTPVYPHIPTVAPTALVTDVPAPTSTPDPATVAQAVAATLTAQASTVPTLAPSPSPTLTPSPSATVALLPTPTPESSATSSETTEQRGFAEATAAPVAIVQGDRVNVREGPGTDYPPLGQVTKNTRLRITSKNPTGDWLQVCCVNDESGWIAAWLLEVEGDISGLQAASHIPAPPPTPTPRPAPTPIPPTRPPPPQPAGTGNVVISYVFFDGAVYRVESDEYAQITNNDTLPVNLTGWRLNAGDPGQDFWFPNFVLQPGESCQVYTNEYHPQSCGFSFGSGRAIWNNKGDCGHLYDASGAMVSQYCY